MPDSPFHPELPALQVAWDSTSLSQLKTCPRKYQYEILQGYRPRAQSVHLTFGIYYHAALERYDHLKSQGASHDDSLDAALNYVLRASVEVLPNGSWRPWQSDDSYKNRETLVRSVIWYLDQFRDDPAVTIQLANGKPAVELSFRFSLGRDLLGHPTLLCGHLDRLVQFQSETWVMDRKSTKSALGQYYFDNFNPDNQMTLYTIAGQVVYNQQVAGVMIDAAQVAVGFTRFQRGFTFRHKDEISEWLEELNFYLSLAEDFAQAGFWPKNDKACGMYGGCPFRSICSQAPKARELLLKTGFHKRPWNPLDTRGDI